MNGVIQSPRLPSTASMAVLSFLLITLLLPAMGKRGPGVAVPEKGLPAEPSAERVEKVLEEIEADYESGKRNSRTYVVSEADLNAFLAARVQEEQRKGVEGIQVRLGNRAFVTELDLNMDELELKDDAMTLALFRSVLSGRRKLEVEGDLTTLDGKGRFEVRAARLNGVSLPPALLTLILSTVGKQLDPPFDPTEPFDLPYGIEEIQVEPRKVTIRT